MIKTVFKALFYKPLYNGFIFLIGTFPFLNVGILIIVFTCLIKLILFPLSRKSIKTQLLMKRLEPEMNKLKEKYKDNREAQARELMAFYKKNDLNPFSGVLLVLIQFPILIALYFVFLKGHLPNVDASLLYSFVKIPHVVNMKFFWIDTIAHKSYILAALASVAQFFQIKLSMPVSAPTNGAPSFGTDMAKMMQVQMKYIFPVIIFFVAYNYSAVIALYLITSSLFAIGQEIVIRKHVNDKLAMSGQMVNN